MKKVHIISLTKYNDLVNIILNKIQDKYEIEKTIIENKIDFLKFVNKFSKKIVSGYECELITISETGSGAFMSAAKVKGMISAQLNDEHSAFMTKEHNNSKSVHLGAKLTSPEVLERIIIRFLDASFEGGRHLVRTDMLGKMG